MRVGLILLLLLVAAYRTQLGNGGQDDQEEVFCKADATTPADFHTILQQLQPSLSDAPLPPINDLVAAAQQVAVTASTSTAAEECMASENPAAAAATFGPSDTGAVPHQASLPATAASTAADASCSGGETATVAGSAAGVAQGATTHTAAGPAASITGASHTAAIDSAIAAPGSAASVQPLTAAGAFSSTGEPSPDDPEFEAVRRQVTSRIMDTTLSRGLDMRHYLSTTTASLKVPSIKTTKDMTEGERRAALAQFAHNLESASTFDIQSLLGTPQPGIPVSVSPQHGAPSTSSTDNNGGTSPSTDADAGPSKEPPKPDNGSCSC